MKPIVITVDDEPQVLNAVYRDLRAHLRGDYRVLKAGSGQEALDTLVKLRERDEPVALVLADQRMPHMEGVELLDRARQIYPDAKKALLTAYADTEAAIRAINAVGLDYYLMKPWDPPEQNLYPVLDDLLADWHASVPPPWDGIRVAGNLLSRASHEVKDFLARNRIPYKWIDVDLDADALARCLDRCEGRLRLPVVTFPDGTMLVQPDRRALADKVGMRTEAKLPFYDLVVIGGGPAGLGAAVYGASEGLSTVLVEKEATGGQAGTSSRIENYLGFPKGLTGADLARRASAQAERLGAELLLPQEVTKIEVEQPYKHVTLADGTRLACYALVVATGMSVRRLEVPGVEAVTGAGVYYGAALSEAANYRDRPVFVVGGANSAGQGAMYFSRYASRVTMVVRRKLEISMSAYLIQQIADTPNIDVRAGTVIDAVAGAEKLESVVVRDLESGATEAHPAAAMYVFIGSRPHTELLAGVCALDPEGFVLTGEDIPREARIPGYVPRFLESSVPGLFVAGDARHGSQKRVAAAVGEGATAIALVHSYLASV